MGPSQVSQLVNSLLKPELENVFGPGITARVLMSARAKANAPIIGMTSEDYVRLVEAIYQDERVVGMWGEAGAREIIKHWKDAATRAFAA